MRVFIRPSRADPGLAPGGAQGAGLGGSAGGGRAQREQLVLLLPERPAQLPAKQTVSLGWEHRAAPPGFEARIGQQHARVPSGSWLPSACWGHWWPKRWPLCRPFAQSSVHIPPWMFLSRLGKRMGPAHFPLLQGLSGHVSRKRRPPSEDRGTAVTAWPRRASSAKSLVHRGPLGSYPREASLSPVTPFFPRSVCHRAPGWV